MKDKRVVFMGTPEFSVPVLEMLIENTNVVMVVTQPDSYVGRKHELNFSPVKEVALKYNIPVFQPQKIRNDYEGFRYAKNSEIAENVTILSQGKVIAYKVKSGDKELVVVHSQAGGVYNLPGSYKLLFNNVDGLVNSSTSITDYMLPVNGTAVFVK